MSKKLNLLNQKFGKLLVIEELPSFKGRSYWKCLCDCGNTLSVIGVNLKNGNTKSCGCLQKEKASLLNSKDLTNMKFERLLVLKKSNLKSRNKEILWECLCDCGSTILVGTYNLTSGNTQSCGCLKSKGEEKIASLLKENNIVFEREKTFENCIFPDSNRKAKFDFFVSNKYLIEYDGIQHFQQSGWSTKDRLFYTKNHDNFKNEWCLKNNIKLIRIPYTILKDLNILDLCLETSNYIVKGENK